VATNNDSKRNKVSKHSNQKQNKNQLLLYGFGQLGGGVAE